MLIPADARPARADRWATDLSGLSRSHVQRLSADGEPVKANTIVRPGTALELRIPPPTPATPQGEPELPLAVVYQDEDLLIVDKPAGQVVHPAPGHDTGTLVNALLGRGAELAPGGIAGVQRPGIVHRLDRGTSGLIVVAKHDAAHDALAKQFQQREVEKEYAALVWGEVMAGRRIDLPVGRDPVNRKRMAAAPPKRTAEPNRVRRSREAVTRIVAAEHFGRLATLARVAIHTGRTHQIRVHLSAIGHPVVGDPLYGGVHRRVPGDLRAVAHLDRPFLHASRLAFAHPSDGRRMEFESPLPPDLQGVLDELRDRHG
jgi:23S rRNA pseudouridine1911/1915/1917 synthase